MDSHVPDRAISSDERQRTVDRLCAHFAQDNLDETELERRLDLAYAARTRGELVALERGLPTLASEATPAPTLPERSTAERTPSVDPSLERADREFMVAIMGGAERKGHWVPPRRIVSFSLMGGTALDFREARFASGEVEVQLFAMMGGVEIIVPPGLRVEWNGVAIMGGVSSGDRLPIDVDAPVVRINGLVLMGGLDIVERHPGESAKEARKRLRTARKAARKLPPGS